MNLYSPEAVYRLDQAAVEYDGYSEIELMGLAGERVWQHVHRRWPQVVQITLFAGSGNNGGDAFVVALCAHRLGVAVQLLVQGDLQKQSATSQYFRELWRQAGGSWEPWQGQTLTGEVIVDGLLGIGLQRELDAEWQALIETINQQPVPRIAIDIPSGLSGYNGNAQPLAVQADLTVTFIGAKTGQYLADGPDYCGELVYEDLGVSSRVKASVAPELTVIETCQLPQPRRKNSHKNHYGHVLLVGGDRGMSGAIGLAAHAALRSGAGLVTALVQSECTQNLASIPEVMTLDWNSLEEKLELATVVVVGPGLGDSRAAHKCLHILSDSKLPMVIDAGALQQKFLCDLSSDQVVITPHPGEAGQLLESNAVAVQADRLQACRKLVESYDLTCVLKGSGTLVADREQTAINVRGNPGMAGAGMGDVLAGMIAAMLGQGLAAFDAARSAVLIHALAAENYAADRDQTGLIASDIIDSIPRIIHRLRDVG